MPITKPEWGKYEEKMHTGNAKEAVEATDKFISVREEEMRKDPSIRRWEESRKESARKDKRSWIEERKKNEKYEEYKRTVKPFRDLLNAGSFNSEVHPMAGYVLVEIEQPKDEATDSGIILVTEQKEWDNMGTVHDFGDSIYCTQCFQHPNKQPKECPVGVGERILFKKGAGMEIDIKGHKMRLMAFSDILAIIYD